MHGYQILKLYLARLSWLPAEPLTMSTHALEFWQELMARQSIVVRVVDLLDLIYLDRILIENFGWGKLK